MMKVAIIFSSLLVACVAYWPQDGFDAASSYASIPLDNTTISPIAALTGGIATSNLAYFEVAATESVSISSQGVMYIPVANKDNGAPSAYIIAHDLKADSVNKTVWLEYINSTGWVPNATDADTVLEIKYTALHEPSSTLFVPVHAGQDLVYFMGLNYTSGAPMWIAHWPCNINSAPRVIASGYIAIMCDNVVHEIEIPTKLNYTHPSQNQPNVTTYALPEVATPYQILATDNSSLYAIRFNGCELDFNEITIPNADLFRPAINITLPANCTAPSSCIAAGNDVFGCGMYLIDLKTSKVMNSTVYLSVHAPDMWIGFTPIGHAAPSVVVYNEDMTVASLSIPLNELRGDNVTITSMAITLERSTGTILVSAAADVFMLPRQLFIYAFNMTGALMYRSQSSHLDDTMWSSVAAGPLIPTDAGSIVMVSRNSSSLFEFTCCSGNGICNTNGNCTCNTNYVSNNCSLFCDSTRCGNHSTGCNDKAVCQCMPGYFGTFCDVYCDNTTCNGHGRCDLGDGSCICDAGYVTPLNNFTTVRGCFGMCSNTSCNMHGECTYLNATVLPAFGQAWTSAGCACHSGFYGDVCTTFCDANATCNNHGTCVNTTMLNMTHVNNTDAGQCQCFAGWYNADCNTYCVANDTCHGAGTCNTDGSCACSDSSMFGFVKSDCTRSVSLSDGAFIGIIVAISVAVLALIILIICCCRRRDAGYTAIRNEGIRNTGN